MKLLTFFVLWAVIEILEKLYKEAVKPALDNKFRLDIIDEPAFLK
jgi:hypothetical protein